MQEPGGHCSVGDAVVGIGAGVGAVGGGVGGARVGGGEGSGGLSFQHAPFQHGGILRRKGFTALSRLMSNSFSRALPAVAKTSNDSKTSMVDNMTFML